MTKQLVIDDDNFREHIGDGETVVIDGKPRAFGCVRTPGRMRAAPNLTFADAGVELIPESQWKARATKLIDEGADLKTLTYDLPALDQDGVGQCWMFGHCGAMRTLSRRQGGVLRLPSVQSLAYSLRSDYRSWGVRGGDPADSMEALMEHGAARDELWPTDPDVGRNSKYATAEAEADRQANRLLVGIELGHEHDIWQELISCLLQGIGGGVAFNWWGHHVEAIAYLPNGNLLIRNSWGNGWGDRGFGELAGAKKHPSGAWAFVRMVQSV